MSTRAPAPSEREPRASVPPVRASTPALQARLDEGFAEAEAEARRTAREPLAPSAGALETLLESRALVDRFLADLREALGQIFIAGLAYPDPELADELGDLAVRAQRLALATPVRRLLCMRTMLRVLATEPDAEARLQLSLRIWHETQQLVAWLRIFRTEHDLSAVQAQLSGHAAERRQRPASDLDTESMSVWPLGLELSARGRAIIHARDLDSEREVVLLDELTELRPDDPMQHRVISRLFQSDVVLAQVMCSVIRLDAHPCVERDGVLVFRPAFAARPQLRGVASSFEPPRAVTLGELTAAQTSSPRAVRMGAVVRRHGRLARLRPAHAMASLQTSTLLDFNLMKLLVREASPSLPVEVTALSGTEPLAVLAIETELDGRVFPSLDPTLFRLDAGVLARRALADPHAATTLPGHWLRAAALLFGGGTEDDARQLRSSALEVPLRNSSEAFRLGLGRFVLGGCPPDPRFEPLVREGLTLAALQPDAALDLDALARVLGLDAASPADRERLDGQFVLEAVWLALQESLVEPLRDVLGAVYRTRYAEPLRDPTLADVCARALLLAIAGVAEPLSEVGDDEEEAALHEGDIELRPGAALEFLEAHIEALAARCRKRRSPLPAPLELFILGDTRARLSGLPRHGATLEPLGLPPERLRSACADALLDWTLDRHSRPGSRTDAADALLVVLAAAMRRWFVAA